MPKHSYNPFPRQVGIRPAQPPAQPAAKGAESVAASGGGLSATGQPVMLQIQVAGRTVGQTLLPDMVRALRHGTGDRSY